MNLKSFPGYPLTTQSGNGILFLSGGGQSANSTRVSQLLSFCILKFFCPVTAMQTNPIYLTNPYQKELTARVLELQPEPAGRWRVMLDQTVFYPMGGGQPTDQGFLTWQADPENPQSEILKGKVYQVMLKEGEIWHYIEKGEGKTLTPPAIGQAVKGEIDWTRRFQNMRVHTGGHLVDFALFRLGYVPETLKPLKADHGKKPYVLYEGNVDDLDNPKLDSAIAKLIEEGLEFSWEFVSLEVLEKDAIYLQPGLPTNKPLRKLTLSGVGSVADGGTLVKSTGEVGTVKILSIERQEDQTRIYYQVG
jgi:alanyl-tRNA synthetase